MDKITKAIADGLVDAFGMDKQKAQILASVILCAAMIALSLGSGFIGGSGQAAQLTSRIGMTLQSIAQAARPAISTATLTMGLFGIGMGAANAVQNYRAGTAQSEVTETEQFLALMRQRLEESEEELNALLMQIQGSIGKIAELLSSQTDTSSEIARHIGQMA